MIKFIISPLVLVSLLSNCGLKEEVKDETLTVVLSPNESRLRETSTDSGSETTSPTKLTASFKALYASVNSDCTGASIIAENESYEDFDFYDTPTLFTVDLPEDQNYTCFIFQMKDSLTMELDETETADFTECIEPQEEIVHDLYTELIESAGQWVSYDGKDVSEASGSILSPETDDVVIFASISPSAVTYGDLSAPAKQVISISDFTSIETPATMTFYVELKNEIIEISETGCYALQVNAGIRMADSE